MLRAHFPNNPAALVYGNDLKQVAHNKYLYIYTF